MATIIQKIEASGFATAAPPPKAGNFFREIVFLAVLNFFPVQKLIFGHF